MGTQWYCDRCGAEGKTDHVTLGCSIRFLSGIELCTECFQSYKEWLDAG